MNLCHLRGRTRRVWTGPSATPSAAIATTSLTSMDATATSLEHVLESLLGIPTTVEPHMSRPRPAKCP